MWENKNCQWNERDLEVVREPVRRRTRTAEQSDANSTRESAGKGLPRRLPANHLRRRRQCPESRFALMDPSSHLLPLGPHAAIHQ